VAGKKTLDSSIGELVQGEYATVTSDTKLELLQGVLGEAKVAIAHDRDKVVGIVTKIDLIEYLAKNPSPLKAAPAKTKKKSVKPAPAKRTVKTAGKRR
jgi:cystathionine beta-synthase